jgi:hypothetical protein
MFISAGYLILAPDEVKTMPNLTITILSGGTTNGSIVSGEVETGLDDYPDQTNIEVMSDVNWKVTASVVVVSNPVGTGNPSPNAIEVGNNDNPGEFNAGGGLVQTGSAGTVTFDVDFRLNLSTINDAPSGNYSYTITYTLEENI